MLDILIDEIYRAHSERHRWAEVLAKVSQFCGSHLAYFHAPATAGGATDTLKRYVTHNMDNDWLDAHYYHYAPQDPFSLDAFAATGFNSACVVQMMAARPEKAALHTPYYQDYCRAMDIGDVMTVMLGAPTVNYTPPTIGFAERWGKGPLEQEKLDRLNLIAPHLRRVGRMMFDMPQVDPALMSSIDLLPYAVFLLREDGSIASANHHGEAALGPRFGLCVRQTHLVSARAASNAVLQRIISQAACATRSSARIGGEIELEGDDGEQATVIVMPLGGDNPFHEQIGPCRAMVYVLPHFDDPALLGKQRLSRLYGLTEAEVEVAHALIVGQSPEDIGAERARSINTVRTQIRNILAKTQRHRISDLHSLRRLIELP